MTTIISLNTTDTVFLIIVAVCLSLYFILGLILLALLIGLVKSLHEVIDKAEDLIDSAEEVTEVFKDAKGNLALFKVMKNIYKYVNRKKK